MSKIYKIIFIFIFILCGCTPQINDHDCENDKHKFGDWTYIREPDCVDTGIRWRYCLYCGSIESEDLDMVAHKEKWIIVQEHNQLQVGINRCVCEVCGEVLDEQIIGHQFDNGKCVLCGIKQEKACQHTYGDWVIVKEPTCTEIGIRYHTCTSCGYQVREDINCLGHITGQTYHTKESTCQEEGIKITCCGRCNTVLLREFLPLIDHIESDEWITDEVATCYSTGLKHKVCEMCGMQMYRNTVIPKQPHTPSDWVIDTDPNCTDAGSKHTECIYCHKTMQTGTIKATGHTWGEWTVLSEPWCMASGKRVRQCSTCSAFDYEVLSHLGHAYENYVCTRCGDNIYDPSWSQGLSMRDGMITGIGSCKDTNIILPKYQPDGIEITSIRYKSFRYSKLKVTIVVPDTYTMIGPQCFEFATINALVISSTKTKFGRYALKDAHITTIVYPGTMRQWKDLMAELANNYVIQGFYGTVSCKDGAISYRNGVD